MSLSRIKGILYQEYYLTFRNLTIIMDLFFFSVMTLIVFGFMSLFLRSSGGILASQYFLVGMILWEIIRITQYSMSVESLWNIWSRNLSNMFISPLSLTEYFIAQMLSGMLKAVIAFFIVSLLSLSLFNFNFFNLGFLNISLFVLNLVIFAWSLGLFLLGLIFRYGQKLQSFAWFLVFIFQPLTGTFFPIEILPAPFQKIAYFLPPTHVFEAARFNLSSPLIRWDLIGISFLENIIYFAISIWFFSYMFKRSKETGQFTKNES